MKKALALSILLSVLAALSAAGGDMSAAKRQVYLQFKPGHTYEIRYTPAGTDKIAVITFSSVQGGSLLGMREMLQGTTPDGETHYIPVDLILDIKEIQTGKADSAQTPTPQRKKE